MCKIVNWRWCCVALVGAILAGFACHKNDSIAGQDMVAAQKTVSPFGAPPSVMEPDESASNTDCLVCHEGLVNELISVEHLRQGIGCRHCHGSSDDHMQDEMQMTSPNFLFGRNEVEPFCKTCHPEHRNPAVVQAFFNQWRGKDRPNGRVVAENSTCTDCHGQHNLHRLATDESATAKWIPLFNGASLAGWKPVGSATWKVENGAIVGRPGPEGVGGELLSAAVHENFLLAVTYRIEWPAAAGVWFRYQTAENALQAAILESKDPPRYTGSIYSPSRDFLAVNASNELVNRNGWNTLSIKAEKKRIEVWLNGNSVTVASDTAATAGKIGFHLRSGKQYAKTTLTIREVLLQPIE